MRCILCGRTTTPAVMLANKHAIGPKCAAKAGLLERARRGKGQLRLFTPLRRPADPQTLDLFAGVA